VHYARQKRVKSYPRALILSLAAYTHKQTLKRRAVSILRAPVLAICELRLQSDGFSRPVTSLSMSFEISRSITWLIEAVTHLDTAADGLLDSSSPVKAKRECCPLTANVNLHNVPFEFFSYHQQARKKFFAPLFPLIHSDRWYQLIFRWIVSVQRARL